MSNDKAMTADHENHLASLLDEIGHRVDAKYRAGQAEHGGRMWEKPGMLAHAIDEAVDQLVYLLTMAEQIRAVDKLLYDELMDQSD